MSYLLPCKFLLSDMEWCASVVAAGGDFSELASAGYIKVEPLSPEKLEAVRAEAESRLYNNESRLQNFADSNEVRLFFDPFLDETADLSCADLTTTLLDFLPWLMRLRYARHRLAMINRLDAREDGEELRFGSGSGWHRDSPIRHQLKFFTFLTDVGSDTGVLRILKNTHKTSQLGRAHKLIGKPMSEFRYTEEDISILLRNGFETHEFACEAGSQFLINTRLIHSGKPLVSGSRLAVTQYLFPNRAQSSSLLG